MCVRPRSAIMCAWRLFVCLVFVPANVLCKTIYLEANAPTLEEVAFLQKYGYMEKTQDSGFETSFTASSVTEAVRRMQGFAGLPQTGVLDAATRGLFKKKRCGVKDITHTPSRSRRYILQQGWNKKTITYRVVNGSSTLSKPRVEALMAAGLAVWAPHGGLRFTRVDQGTADIQVSFAREDHGDGFPFDGPGHVVAHAFQPPHGEMHFDDDESWGEGLADESDDVTDFFAVAVHEIGHALGLSHSDVKASVMYPYYQVPVEKLHLDDILGMQELYRKDESFEEEKRPEITEAPMRSPLVPRFTKADRDADDDVIDDENEIPDLCYTNYNTLQVIQGKLFVFEEEWVWVIEDKVVAESYPRRFHELFRGLPHHVTYIKAIYEKRDGNIVIFSGRKFWEFDASFRLRKVGRLTEYGLPRYVREVTTAFLSNYNNRTYLMEDERFWRRDDTTRTMDKGYPKDMSAWRDVPYPVDAAVIWKEDTYFFQGPRFWRFDNELIRAHAYYPLPVAQVWFPCAPTPDMPRYFTNDEP